MEATYVQRGEYIDFIPATDVNAGDVVVNGKLVGITKLAVKAGELGAIATLGVFDVNKEASAVHVGDVIYWNGDKATVSPDNGRTGVERSEYTRLGLAVAEAAISDGTVRILLNA